MKLNVPTVLRRILGMPEPDMPALPRVLVISAFDHDQKFFAGLHNAGTWDITLSGNVDRATELLSDHSFSIIVYDRDLPGWEWREVLTRLRTWAPQTAVVLMSRVIDNFLWKEVLSHGGYDLLPKPLDHATANRVLRRAWYYRKATEQ